MIADIVDIEAAEDLCGCLELPIREDCKVNKNAERNFILWDPARPSVFQMVAESGEAYAKIDYQFTDEDEAYIRKVASEYAIY